MISQYSGGDFANEPSACADLDRRLEHWRKYLKPYTEVCGDILHPRPQAESKRVRIDRLVFAMHPLVELGWVSGAIGIEIKKSDTKLGKVVAQCEDYTRSSFATQDNGNIIVIPTWVFIWPVDEPPRGDVASIMAQNRIGSVRPCGEIGLRFLAGPKCVIELPPKGEVKVSAPPCGNRAGSR